MPAMTELRRVDKMEEGEYNVPVFERTQRKSKEW